MARPNELFQTLRGELGRHLIASFQPGERLPSTRALSAMYGVGTMTVHRVLRSLVSDNIVCAKGSQGWMRTPLKRRKTLRRTHVRIGLISPLTRAEWSENRFYKMMASEARRRKIELIEIPNPRADRATPERNRIDLRRVPWNDFDLALLIDIEDSATLSNPILAGRRVLAVDRDATPYGLDSVTFDNVGAGRIAARYLFELGHRRFAITDETSEPGWPSEQTWLARRHGFESAIGFLGGCIRPEWRLAIPHRGFQAYHFHALRATIAGWSALPAKRRPTAVFCFDENFAGIVRNELAKHHLAVPHDFSILGVGGRSAGKVPKSGQPNSFVWMEFTTLARRTFDAAEELAAERTPRKFRAAKLYTTPVVLIPGASTREPV